ncbi:RNA-directed DNA polymerase from mobile element jockey-like [Elysia marginata]|uniref:RNA-directed DNA polymerase from mobile element jockey-like n=1 Tax=Elysia marginata TaxID=1093978 RepID=A0AAV4J467_9GAST|nr:RNA-directed DNA polymerase from mobile element jockey-like [Elysia marginata]
MDEDILMETNDSLNRSSEYMTELYRDDRGPPTIISNEDEGLHILREEAQKAVKKMKKGKSAGPKDILSEMLTTLGKFVTKRSNKTSTHYICYRCEVLLTTKTPTKNKAKTQLQSNAISCTTQ